MSIPNVNILTNYSTALRFRKMSEFKLDLGKGNLKQEGKNTVMEIVDKFIDHIYNNNGFLCFKIGTYGSITFFYANILESNVLHIFINQQEHEINIPSEIKDSDLENWLSKKLYDLIQKEEIKVNEI